jgi:UDP-3-O-[3-hydroxymyristoyl] glucosamine N-acyltransferase
MKLGELIETLGGKLEQGSLEQDIAGVSSPGRAHYTDLIFAEDEASVSEALLSPAAAVVLKPVAAAAFTSNPSIAVIESDQPRLWFARAAKLLRPEPPCDRIHSTAVIGEGAVLGGWVTVGACAVIGKDAIVGERTRIEAGAVIGEGVRIGDHCRIYPRVVIYPGTYVGNRVTVHAGAVLGADGFGYVRDSTTGAYTQFPQLGGLVIEDDVEIGANTTIDRGALGATRVGRGTKFDNLVHVGHNCEIGEDVILVAGVGISGSCTVGNGAVIAGQVGIGDHAHIGPGVILGGQAGVLSGKTVTNEGMGVKPGTVLWGTPARPLHQVLRELAIVSRLAKKRGAGNRE